MESNSNNTVKIQLEKWMDITSPSRVQSNIVHFCCTALSAPRSLDEIANTSTIEFFQDLEQVYRLMEAIRSNP